MIVVLSIVVFCALHYLFPVIQVIGESMYPTYIDGEILIGTRLYKKSKLDVGEVILYKSPTDDRTVIKRINSIQNYGVDGREFYCVGDNLDNSYDCRHYGYISSEAIVCKVINQRRNRNL